jgi:error-prone DNA polymerase
LSKLAECGALEGLTASRRAALGSVWKLAGGVRDGLALGEKEGVPMFEDLGALATVVWDYRGSGHSARGHPVAGLRDELRRQGLLAAAAVGGLVDGAGVCVAGLVICRQRPGTAKGVLFMTLEDETGFVNLVVWEKVFERYAAVVKTEGFLAVRGKVPRQGEVVHVVVRRVWVPRLGGEVRGGGSRDFR